MRQNRLAARLAAGAVAASSGIGASASAAVFTYNPSLGTLPEAQGWAFSGSYNAPMSVASGTLTYGPTTVSGTTFWEAEQPDALNFNTDSASFEARIRLSGAGFGNFSGFRRGGFSLYLVDDVGRWIIAELGDNTISLGNDNNRTSDPSAAFDLTDDFHTVRLEAGPSGGRLFVDGTLMLSLGLGSGAAAGAAGFWGEATVLTRAIQTEVQSVIYIPAPGAAGLLLASAIGIRRRRN
jgi:hypothetical protein